MNHQCSKARLSRQLGRPSGSGDVVSEEPAEPSAGPRAPKLANLQLELRRKDADVVSGEQPEPGDDSVAKLANFPDIDAFVLVACPENSIVGSKEFMQPVVTPFELDIALNRNRNWTTGEYHADFQDLLPGGKSYKEFHGHDSDSTDVSLITGRLRTTGLDINVEKKAVMAQQTALAALHTGGGGQYLAQRSWQGLEQKLGETPLVKAEKGRKGIAMGYDSEG